MKIAAVAAQPKSPVVRLDTLSPNWTQKGRLAAAPSTRPNVTGGKTDCWSHRPVARLGWGGSSNLASAIGLLALGLACLALVGCQRNARQAQPANPSPSSEGRLAATIYDSGFPLAHDSYNGISSASDGKIYYVLSSQDIDTGAQIYSFDPGTEKIQHLGDLTEVCGEKGLKAIPQNKSHVRFWESNGKLYFASHIGYYTIKNGMETMGVPPPGYKPYPGGHFLSYDLASGQFENLALAPHGEGIIAMTMDPARGRLYGITWPTGYFIRYDLRTKDLKDLGAHSELGESVRGPHYRTICRSLAVDPRDGSVYFTTADGAILRYCYDRDAIETVAGEDLRKDYFGVYDPTSSGTMGYNWRQVAWYGPENMVYGVHGNSGYLFRFDPRVPRVEVLDRITSVPSQRSGMYDEFSYGYLGFILGPDGNTLYYLTGGPIYREGRRVAGKSVAEKGESRGEEDLHLITYYIPTRKYVDHGAIYFPDGQRPHEVNSIAVGSDGCVYALAAVTQNGKNRTDLMRVRGPFPSH